VRSRSDAAKPSLSSNQRCEGDESDPKENLPVSSYPMHNNTLLYIYLQYHPNPYQIAKPRNRRILYYDTQHSHHHRSFYYKVNETKAFSVTALIIKSNCKTEIEGVSRTPPILLLNRRGVMAAALGNRIYNTT